MKKYFRQEIIESDFSLHDAKIINFEFDYDKNRLILTTDCGFTDIKKDELIEGNIIIQDVYIEDSYVYLMEYKNVLCGNIGSFLGEKMTLDTFIRSYPSKFTGFELVGEYDGYQTFIMSGFISKKGEKFEELEARFEIYYRGNFIYEVKE